MHIDALSYRSKFNDNIIGTQINKHHLFNSILTQIVNGTFTNICI